MKLWLIACYSQLLKELLISLRRLASCLNPLLFFMIVIVLFPLAISPETSLLHSIAPGIIWIGALLANMLSIDSLFQQDYQDGTLEQLLVNPTPLPLLVIAKISAQWLLSALPLILITPLLGIMLQMHADEIAILMLSLLLGTPILSCVGTIGAAITVSLAARGILLTVLILPLTIPVLILGAGSVVAFISGVSALSSLLVLLALLILALVFTPLASAAALRLSQF